MNPLHKPLSYFEVTAAGFDGSTDETDDRVLWVSAANLLDVERLVVGLDANVVPLPDYFSGEDLDFELPRQNAEFVSRCQTFKTLTDQLHAATEIPSP